MIRKNNKEKTEKQESVHLQLTKQEMSLFPTNVNLQ